MITKLLLKVQLKAIEHADNLIIINFFWLTDINVQSHKNAMIIFISCSLQVCFYACNILTTAFVYVPVCPLSQPTCTQ